MTDPKKTEELLLVFEQRNARTKYEGLLDEVLREMHALIEPIHDIMPLDDSRVHELLQRLRDEFGPEVKS